MGAVFGIFAGFYHLFHKMTALNIPESYGQIHF